MSLLDPIVARLDAVVRRIPEGRVSTVGSIIETQVGLDEAAIVGNLAAVAAGPDERRAPVWRVVRDDGALLEELPGGIAAQARMLASEGVTVLHLGKVPKVTTVEHFAWRPPPLGKGAGKGGAAGKVTGKPRR